MTPSDIRKDREAGAPDDVWGKGIEGRNYTAGPCLIPADGAAGRANAERVARLPELEAFYLANHARISQLEAQVEGLEELLGEINASYLLNIDLQSRLDAALNSEGKQ